MTRPDPTDAGRVDSGRIDPGGAPVVSVVVCTHDRAELLRLALASLAAQAPPPGGFEVVLVDNRSTDHTPAVAAEFATRLPLRYVHEPEMGLCIARNTGWRAARGTWVAYFDDDAEAEPGWLTAVADAFARHPDAGVVGGRVIPVWEAPQPAWLSDHAARVLTIVDWPGGEHVIADLAAEWLVGVNMAVPRRVLEAVGGFHPWLDRVGTNMLSSGDVFLQKAVVARGLRCVYDPRMAVRHLVGRERLTKAWFQRRYYWQGVSDAVMELIEESPSRPERVRRAAARSARLLPGLLAHPTRLGALAAPPDDPARFEEACWTWIAMGHVAGLLGAAGR